MAGPTLEKLMEDSDNEWKQLKLPGQEIWEEKIVPLYIKLKVSRDPRIQEKCPPEKISSQEKELTHTFKKELNDFLKIYPNHPIAKKTQALINPQIISSEPSKIDTSHHTPHN